MESIASFFRDHGFTLLLLFTVLILAAYIRGRRINLAMAKRLAALMENRLRPLEKEYTWIGGLTGFKAAFTLEGGLEARATLVMKPRQSLLYLPLSMLIFGGDKLFLVFKELEGLPAECHALSARYRRIPRAWLPSPDDFSRVVREERGGAAYTLYARHEQALETMRELLDRLSFPGLLHAALLAESRTAYFALDPNAAGLDGFLAAAAGFAGKNR
jgi:hypothetical protein